MATDPSEDALDRLLRDDGRRSWRLRWPTALERPRPLPWLAGAAVVALAVVGGWWWSSSGTPPPELDLPLASAAPPAATTTTTPADVVVHAAGAVAAPGLVRLPGGSRWADALEAAGGPRPDADLDRVNLALPLVDGARVYVPRVGETAPPPLDGPAASPAGRQGDGDAPVDVNSADAAELESLPGVGEATAAAILDHREEHGPFRSPDDLLDVRGIGPAKLEALRDLVTFGP